MEQNGIEMRIKRLDKRNNGFGKFKYYVMPTSRRMHEIRAWCWETWGSSKELSEWLSDDVNFASNPLHEAHCYNDHWCWQNDEYYCRLYLRTDEELAFFKLKWL